MIKLRPEDITRYRFLSSMRMSPSGKTGAVMVSQANLQTNGYDAQIWKLDTATEKLEIGRAHV